MFSTEWNLTDGRRESCLTSGLSEGQLGELYPEVVDGLLVWRRGVPSCLNHRELPALPRWRGRNAVLNVVAEDVSRTDGRLSLDEICRQGAQRMLGAALEAEAGAYVESFVDELDGDGHRLVVRNGHARARQVTTVAGAVEVTAPRVNDQRVDAESGERCGFKSSIVPPWARKSPKVTEVTEVLPLLYLHGMSTGDFSPALEGFFGNAAGLSASTVGRLTESWQDEHRAFAKRSLADRDFVYVWVDGV